MKAGFSGMKPADAHLWYGREPRRPRSEGKTKPTRQQAQQSWWLHEASGFPKTFRAWQRLEAVQRLDDVWPKFRIDEPATTHSMVNVVQVLDARLAKASLAAAFRTAFSGEISEVRFNTSSA